MRDSKVADFTAFRSLFWCEVKKDLAATDVVHRLRAQGQPLRDRSVRILAIVSDPDTDSRLKLESPNMVRAVTDYFIPSRKSLLGLSERMKTLGRDLERTFLMPGLLHPKTQHLLKFAATCTARASEIASIKPPMPLTYKSFSKHLPIMMLCLELDVPNSLSFPELEYLVDCADQVRGRGRRPRRGIQRQYERFTKNRPHSIELVKALSAVIIPRH